MFESILNLIERRFAFILTAVLILRVSYLSSSDLDLIGDESYYWDWSRRLDWCYYSKPPMVAWLIAASTAVFGDNALGVRLPAVLLGTLALYFLYETAKGFYSSRAGALAVLIALAMPFNVLANFLMTIDAPLNCFWIASMYFLRKALFDHVLKAWLWAGVATGAALLSKQVAILIPLMLMVFLLADSSRRHLFKREFLLYLFPVLVCLTPILWWNQQHDWVMFGHSQGHFGNPTPVNLQTHLQNAGVFSLYQLLLTTPVLYTYILVISFKKLCIFNRLIAKEQFLLLLGPVLLLGILGLSFLQKVQGNWPMPFYLSSAILISGQSLVGIWQKSLKIGLTIGGVMVLLTYALPVAIDNLKLHNTSLDPLSRFRHWKEVSDSVESMRRQVTRDYEGTILITRGHRCLTSQLAFYLPDQPVVYHYEASGKTTSQYDVWDGPEKMLGSTALIVTTQNNAAIPSELIAAFQSFNLVGHFTDPMNLNNRYDLYLGEKLKYWPKSSDQTGNID
ncbi:MAG: glycosyltransferase family 39 protein [Methylococcaceae bacterium]|nr:glycosyltransferase family 39 protein [Methylococcaceae bacterium]